MTAQPLSPTPSPTLFLNFGIEKFIPCGLLRVSRVQRVDTGDVDAQTRRYGDRREKPTCPVGSSGIPLNAVKFPSERLGGALSRWQRVRSIFCSSGSFDSCKNTQNDSNRAPKCWNRPSVSGLFLFPVFSPLLRAVREVRRLLLPDSGADELGGQLVHVPDHDHGHVAVSAQQPAHRLTVG